MGGGRSGGHRKGGVEYGACRCRRSREPLGGGVTTGRAYTHTPGCPKRWVKKRGKIRWGRGTQEKYAMWHSMGPQEHWGRRRGGRAISEGEWRPVRSRRGEGGGRPVARVLRPVPSRDSPTRRTQVDAKGKKEICPQKRTSTPMEPDGASRRQGARRWRWGWGEGADPYAMSPRRCCWRSHSRYSVRPL